MYDKDRFLSTADPRVNPLYDDEALPYEAVQAVSDIMYYLEEQTNTTANLLIAKGQGAATDGHTIRGITGQLHLFGILRETLDQATYMHERRIRQGIQEEMIKREAEAEAESLKRRNSMKVRKTTIIEMPGPDKDPR